MHISYCYRKCVFCLLPYIFSVFNIEWRHWRSTSQVRASAMLLLSIAGKLEARGAVRCISSFAKIDHLIRQLEATKRERATAVIS
jgi:hypothetical protein